MISARLLVFVVLGVIHAAVQAQTPTLYFTDLTSGPVGAIVTVYGANLQPPVSVNGVNATVVASSPQKVSFIVPNTTSGTINMGASNQLNFAVRPGNIYFVASNGSNTQSGSRSAPWASIPFAFNAAACGDIIYVMDGVTQTAQDAYSASLSVQRICNVANPLAVVGYPGATVTIGSATGLEYGIRNPDINGDGYNGMVFANLVVRGNNEGLKMVGNQYWRIVGNDFSCPYGGGESGCVIIDQSSNVQFLGNSIHNTGAGGTKYYHSFYATTNSNHIEVGWNHIYSNQSCRGVQFYSTSGSPQYDLIVHDNIISDQECDGINFSTVDATQGPVEAYNNLVYHVGLGGTNDGTPNEACIASLGLGVSGGQTLFFGNTMADCGSGGGSTAGAITVQSGAPIAVITSNLVIQNSGEPVYSSNTNTSLVQSNNNVLLISGTAGVVDANYRLVPGSPALSAGIASPGVLFDLAGNPRPQSGSEDAGAYLYSSGSAVSDPIATISPLAIDFGIQTIMVASLPHVVTLSNTGGSVLELSSVSVTGTDAAQFALSSSCGSSLAPGSSCTLSIIFTPSAATTYNAAVSIADNAAGSPQTVPLSGTGTNPATPGVSLSPTSLTFSATVGATSPAQTVTLRNGGTAALNIGGISITGANASRFAQTSTCGASLPAGSSCTISVTFTPSAATTYSAAVSIADNATGSPQTVPLSGTGTNPTAPGVSLSPTSLTFTVAVGATAPAQTVTLRNSGAAVLNISGISITGASASSFAQTSTCGASLAAGSSCAISVTFTPSATTTYNAAVSIVDNATGSPQTVSLTGTGSNAPDFSLNAAPGSQSIPAGGSATFTVTLGSSGGSFSQPVSLSVSGYPPGSLVAFSPAQVVPSGESPKSVLTVQTVATASSDGSTSPWPAAIPVLAILLCVRRLRMGRFGNLALVITVVGGVASLAGCAHTRILATPKSYTLVISGSSSVQNHTTSVGLTVQ